MREECGTVDFYPNRGSRLQPGCSVLALDDVIGILFESLN